MFQHVVVPIDDSEAAWRAVPVAARMASAVDGKLDLVTVVDRVGAVENEQRSLQVGLDRLGSLPVDARPEVLVHDSVAQAIGDHVESLNGAIVVMSSHGHGRSASVLGSTTDDVLRATYGPVVVVGPHVAADAGELGGTYVVPLDGSPLAATVLPIVSAWSVEFGGTPWLLEVIDPGVVTPSDMQDSAYVARRARETTRIDRPRGPVRGRAPQAPGRGGHPVRRAGARLARVRHDTRAHRDVPAPFGVGRCRHRAALGVSGRAASPTGASRLSSTSSCRPRCGRLTA